MSSFELGTFGMQSGSTELLPATFGINGVRLLASDALSRYSGLVLFDHYRLSISRLQACRLLAVCRDVTGFGSTRGL